MLKVTVKKKKFPNEIVYKVQKYDKNLRIDSFPK